MQILEQKLKYMDVYISGYNEKRPSYPGGIWVLRGGNLLSIYKGNGVFGLCWGDNNLVLLGMTRAPETPVLAFRLDNTLFGTKHSRLHVEYKNYIPAIAVHGCWIWNNKLFVVAAQGDPDSAICTNKEFEGHHVGKVIISDIDFGMDRVLISDSIVWNPFECDHHHHYNDIFVNDDYIYLSSFSTCNEKKQMLSGGTISRFHRDLSLEQIITDELDAPHSMQLFEDRLYVCSSRASSIYSMAPRSSEEKIKLEYKGINNFIRGLQVTSEYFFVGLSKSSGRTNSAHLTDPINGILKYNRKNGETHKIDMPPDCDNVYCILMR